MKKLGLACLLLFLALSVQATLPLRFVIEDASLSKEVVKAGEEFEVTVNVHQAYFTEAKGIGVELEGPVEGRFEPEATDFAAEETRTFRGTFRVKEGTPNGEQELEVGVREGSWVRTRQSIYIIVGGGEPDRPPLKDWPLPSLAGLVLAAGLFGLFWFLKGSH